MRPFALLFAALTVVPGALAVDELKSVNFLVFDNKLSDDQIAKARKLITDKGGRITHDFHHPWGGFSAIAPNAAVKEVTDEYGHLGMNIEEDAIVRTNQGGKVSI